MHTLKNCVHYSQNVVTIYSYLEMWCNCYYVWLIASHIKYNLNIVMFNWLHLIDVIFKIRFTLLFYKLHISSKIDAHYM